MDAICPTCSISRSFGLGPSSSSASLVSPVLWDGLSPSSICQVTPCFTSINVYSSINLSSSAHAERVGIAKHQIPFLLSISGIAGTVGRLFFGWIGDHPKVKWLYSLFITCSDAEETRLPISCRLVSSFSST